jgi:RNA polymerase sigma-70 factor (ECF subfamily)
MDSDALAAIHDTYYPLIFRYIAFRIGDRDAAQDLTGDVFTRLLSALHDRSAPQRTLRGWLFGVAAHVVADYHRKSYRAPLVALDEELLSEGASPDEEFDAMLQNENLRQAVAELTDEQQNVIALRFGQAMPIQDVARMMGKSEGAVKQLQARALAMLARKLSLRSEIQ